jgi:hypothetical protein
MNDLIQRKPYSFKMIVLFAFGAALCSLFVSISMLWYQAQESVDHITGRVVSVEERAIVVVSARGATTTLLITPETKIGDISPLSELRMGTPVMAAGQFIDRTTFEANGIRRFNKPEP